MYVWPCNITVLRRGRLWGTGCWVIYWVSEQVRCKKFKIYSILLVIRHLFDLNNNSIYPCLIWRGSTLYCCRGWNVGISILQAPSIFTAFIWWNKFYTLLHCHALRSFHLFSKLIRSKRCDWVLAHVKVAYACYHDLSLPSIMQCPMWRHDECKTTM